MRFVSRPAAAERTVMRTRMIVVVLLSALWLGGCGFATVDFPAVTNLTGAQISVSDRGVQVERYNAVFRNGATLPAVAVVMGYGKELARLGPGGLAVDNRIFQWHREMVPVSALYYENLGEGKLGKFVGCAWGNVQLYPGQPVSQPLTFRLENILRPDGSYFQSQWNGRSLDHPAPVADLREEEVHLPRQWWMGINGLQSINCSLFTVRVRVNGNRVVATIGPEGGFTYWRDTVISDWGALHSIQVDYLQKVGEQFLLIQSSQDIPLNLQAHEIVGRQLIIGPPTRGAQLY